MTRMTRMRGGNRRRKKRCDSKLGRMCFVCVERLLFLLKIAQRFNAGFSITKRTQVPLGTEGSAPFLLRPTADRTLLSSLIRDSKTPYRTFFPAPKAFGAGLFSGRTDAKHALGAGTLMIRKEMSPVRDERAVLIK